MPRIHRRSTALIAASCVGCLLIAIPVIASLLDSHEDRTRILVFSVLTVAIGLAGIAYLARTGLVTSTPAEHFNWRPLAYILALSVPWAMVIVDTPHATYFLLALIGMSLWLLPQVTGSIVALALTGFTALGQVVHHGWSTGSVMGPLLVALVMLGFMHMYRAMLSNARETTRLYLELQDAQEQLANSERQAGRLAERTRLGRDLHDTVAQSLSSIQMLLHLAESDPQHRDDHMRTARDAAAQSLHETRAFISALTPPDLEGRTLAAALERVVDRARGRATGDLTFALQIDGEPRPLSMPIDTTLVRITQASLDNVIAHAGASHCTVTLAFEPESVRLEIDDDGLGFDPEATLAAGPAATHGYGLPMLHDRARELGGYAAVLSGPAEPDGGTLVGVTIPTPPTTREGHDRS